MAKPDSEDVDVNGGEPLKRVVAALLIFGGWSVCCVSLLHAFWERFDITSVIVAMVAAVPILAFVFRSIEVSYGDKKVALLPHRVLRAFGVVDALERRTEEREAELSLVRREGQGASPITSDAEAAAPRPDNRPSIGEPERDAPASDNPLTATDDDIVFIRLRSELKRRLDAIATANGLTTAERSASDTLQRLQAKGLLSDGEVHALAQLLSAGNAQAHGAAVNPGLAEFARGNGGEKLTPFRRREFDPQGVNLGRRSCFSRGAGES